MSLPPLMPTSLSDAMQCQQGYQAALNRQPCALYGQSQLANDIQRNYQTEAAIKQLQSLNRQAEAQRRASEKLRLSVRLINATYIVETRFMKTYANRWRIRLYATLWPLAYVGAVSLAAMAVLVLWGSFLRWVAA